MSSEHKRLCTDVFSRLGNKPDCISEDDLDILESFVIELYLLSVQNNPPASLGSMRLENFRSSADDDLRKLPPSRGALREHAKRASYQAGYLWMEALENLSLPDAILWGWLFDEKKNIFVPRWQSETCPVTIEKFTQPANVTNRSAGHANVPGCHVFRCVDVQGNVNLHN